MRKAGLAYSVQRNVCLWTRTLPTVRKLYSPDKKHMSSNADIRPASTEVQLEVPAAR